MEANKELPSVLLPYWPSEYDIHDMQQLAEAYAVERNKIECESHKLLERNGNERKETITTYQDRIERLQRGWDLASSMYEDAKNEMNRFIQDSILQRQRFIEAETVRINILNLWLEQQKEKLKNKKQ